jgi:PhnB protein
LLPGCAGHLMPQASSTPVGFRGATPYLIFDGTAADAIVFYREVFAATELPGRLTNPAGRILDAAILIGDSVIRVGDEAPWRIAKSPRTLGGASSFVHLYVTDADAVIERAVALGARILLPIRDQFYGDRAGSFADPFEQAWTIATHKEDLSPEEIRRRFADSLRGS